MAFIKNERRKGGREIEKPKERAERKNKWEITKKEKEEKKENESAWIIKKERKSMKYFKR